jgi:cytochrome c553
MNFVRWALLALAAVSLPAMAAGDPEAGREKANTCMGCHGIPGYSNAYPTFRVPKLGGQSPEYLAIALKGYRNGMRPHSTMHAQAESLSDQDIADLSAYLATAPTHRSER